MDEFIVRFTLSNLRKRIDEMAAVSESYYTNNDAAIDVVRQRVMELETKDTQVNGSINTLRQDMDAMTLLIQGMNRELNKTKLINVKQDLLIRTLHNLTIFDAYDMYTDTFATGDGIDWDSSQRAALITDLQAIGLTNDSIIEIQQSSAPTTMLVSKNGSSDEAFSQTFVVYKAKELDKISLHLAPFSEQTYLPITVSLRELRDGVPLASITLTTAQVGTGWIDLDISNIMLVDGRTYYIDVRTDDIYGYKIGVDTTDLYLPGTSYSLYSGVWTDNNFDIAFKVWCYRAEDENNATVITMPRVLATTPEKIVFDKDDVLDGGSITYYVSRNAGVNWKILESGIETDLNDLPAGKTIVVKAYILGTSRINAWGYVVSRGDS